MAILTSFFISQHTPPRYQKISNSPMYKKSVKQKNKIHRRTLQYLILKMAKLFKAEPMWGR